MIPLDFHQKFHRAIENSVVRIIDDAGHAPFAEKPALTSELVRDYLAER